jgi:hypothetical protein
MRSSIRITSPTESKLMGPVEQAIRARFRPPVTLYTLGRRSPFVIEQIDDSGIVLLLGKGRHWTPLAWGCLENLVPYLRRASGWVRAGGTYVIEGEPGTLDEPLKKCLNRQTSRWVAVVLREAGVVDADPGPPLRVKLAERLR